MDVWPQEDIEIFDEVQGRQIKSKIFGLARIIPWKKTVRRSLLDIIDAVEGAIGNTAELNITHYLVSYGIPLGNKRVLEFGLVNLFDEPLDINTKYIVSVRKY